MQHPNLEVMSKVFEVYIVNSHFIDSLNVPFSAVCICFAFMCLCAFVSIHASLQTLTVMT